MYNNNIFSFPSLSHSFSLYFLPFPILSVLTITFPPPHDISNPWHPEFSFFVVAFFFLMLSCDTEKKQRKKENKKRSLMLKVFPSKWCVGFSSYSLFHSLAFLFALDFPLSTLVFFFIPYPQSNSPRYCSWIQTTFFHFFLSSIFFSIFMKLFHFIFLTLSLSFFFLSLSLSLWKHISFVMRFVVDFLWFSYDFLMFRIFLSICFVSLAYV